MVAASVNEGLACPRVALRLDGTAHYRIWRTVLDRSVGRRKIVKILDVSDDLWPTVRFMQRRLRLVGPLRLAVAAPLAAGVMAVTACGASESPPTVGNSASATSSQAASSRAASSQVASTAAHGEKTPATATSPVTSSTARANGPAACPSEQAVQLAAADPGLTAQPNADAGLGKILRCVYQSSAHTVTTWIYPVHYSDFARAITATPLPTTVVSTQPHPGFKTATVTYQNVTVDLCGMYVPVQGGTHTARVDVEVPGTAPASDLCPRALATMKAWLPGAK